MPSQSFIVDGHYTYKHMPCLIIVDCTRVESATASFKDWYNSTGLQTKQQMFW